MVEVKMNYSFKEEPKTPGEALFIILFFLGLIAVFFGIGHIVSWKVVFAFVAGVVIGMWANE